jgi:Exocyst complex subunit Sec15 C-terminal
MYGSAEIVCRLSSAKKAQPSAYLQDVVAFLTTVVRTALQNLPQDIKPLVYFDALDHLAESLKVYRAPNIH